MQRLVLIIPCLIPLLTGCVIKQAERQQVEVEKRLMTEQQQIDKVEKQIKDLKEATAY
jgi:hypothetical protein